jgi:hypothetical protein
VFLVSLESSRQGGVDGFGLGFRVFSQKLFP